MYNVQHQDTISFQLQADKTIINDTVKITATITAILKPGTSEATFRAEVKSALAAFIPVDWKYSNTQRSLDTGFERVVLTATTRVSESENYNLEGRAKLASKEGLEITDIIADTSIPADKLREAERLLRAEILQLANEERKIVNETFGREYRLGTVSFSGVALSASPFNIATYYSGNGATGATGAQGPRGPSGKTPYGSGGSSDDDALANAAKITVSATVVLSLLVA